ncbi:hypothetical protein [Nocardia sp. NPDC048505]|uniref:hypothetical protein n=1 Tax=unclassified Nocardia TaxID=2637762 RepID=UPI0033D2E8F7
MTYPPQEPYPGSQQQPYPGSPEPYPASYQPYGPGGGTKPPVPSTVQNAFYAMIAGAVLTVLSTLLVFTQLDAVRDAVQEQDAALTDSQIDGLVVFSIAVTVVVNVISAGLWIWMAFATRAGKNWARITASVLFGVNTLFTLLGLVGSGVFGASENAVGLIFSVILWLVGLAAIVLLWLKQSAPYFKPAPPPGYGPPPGYAPPPAGA